MNLESLENGSVRCPEDPGEPGYDVLSRRISISPDDAEILRAMAWGRAVAYEIGTGLGVSTRVLATACRFVVTNDIDPWVHENVWPHLPSNVLCMQEREQNITADLIFIDGLHTYDAVLKDTEFAVFIARPKGLVVFHDIDMPVVEDAVRQAMGLSPIKLNTRLGWLPAGGGL